jgi:hypothetical protein
MKIETKKTTSKQFSATWPRENNMEGRTYGMLSK